MKQSFRPRLGLHGNLNSACDLNLSQPLKRLTIL
jgi:hypothetical protein